MKKILLTTALSALVFGFVGFIIGKSTQEVCTRKHVNHLDDGRIVVIPIDTVDGRPTFNVLFSDEIGLDSMYGEEIANGLVTGKWKYDEDFVISVRKAK